MGQDTVLIGAFYFSAIGGAIWLILRRLQASSLPGRVKRLLTYGLLGLLVVTAIYVIHWHSQNRKENFTGNQKCCRPLTLGLREADKKRNSSD